MSKSTYIEDIFLSFSDLIYSGSIKYDHGDFSPISSFSSAIGANRQLTKKQADFIIRLLDKYKNLYQIATGDDISTHLNNPVWRNTFRVLDVSKQLTVHREKDGVIVIHAKFPFSLKEKFVKEFQNKNGKMPAAWDDELKLQRIKLFDINAVRLLEFAEENGFEISQDFYDIVAQYEEFWQNEQDFSPAAQIINSTVELINCPDTAKIYFENNKTNSITQDLFLARSMGFPLTNAIDSSSITTIFSSTQKSFWIKELPQCISLIKQLDNYPIVIFLDRASNVMEDTIMFVTEFVRSGFDSSMVKVCFRFSNDEEGGKKFNQWIKESGVGGAMREGKIFICQHKPPKWMTTSEFNPKLLISNSLYPHTNVQTTTFIKNHHTVLHVGNVKPSANKDNQIVEL